MSASEIVREYFAAYENKDRHAMESLLSEDFVFTSPYDYRIDRQTYFNRCWPFSGLSPIYSIEKLIEQKDEVFVLYKCKSGAGNARNAEFFTIKENKIKEVEVFFGTAPMGVSTKD